MFVLLFILCIKIFALFSNNEDAVHDMHGGDGKCVAVLRDFVLKKNSQYSMLVGVLFSYRNIDS